MASRRARGDGSPTTTETVVPGPRSDDAAPALPATEAAADREPVTVPAPREGEPADPAPAWDEVWLPQWTGPAGLATEDGDGPEADTTARQAPTREALVRAALELEAELQALRPDEDERTDLQDEEERAALRLAAEVLAAESARAAEPAAQPEQPAAEDPEPAEAVAVRTPPVAPRWRARVLVPLAVLLVAAGVGLASAVGSADPERPTVAAAEQDAGQGAGQVAGQVAGQGAGQGAGGAAATTPGPGRARTPGPAAPTAPTPVVEATDPVATTPQPSAAAVWTKITTGVAGRAPVVPRSRPSAATPPPAAVPGGAPVVVAPPAAEPPVLNEDLAGLDPDVPQPVVHETAAPGRTATAPQTTSAPTGSTTAPETTGTTAPTTTGPATTVPTQPDPTGTTPEATTTADPVATPTEAPATGTAAPTEAVPTATSTGVSPLEP
ncbi:hypothetical protein [Modestobacter sp. I12A-02662]|uniref:hypothetical protein n=1 Tax=Modestobacter sp. I12A-02662 TaxID=1730496 RepID=UPI0034DFE93A